MLMIREKGLEKNEDGGSSGNGRLPEKGILEVQKGRLKVYLG